MDENNSAGENNSTGENSGASGNTSAVENSSASSVTAFFALICGVFGLIGAFIPVVRYFTLFFAILAIVLGVAARKAAPKNKRKMATLGLVLGIISTGFAILMIVCVSICTGALISGITSLFS